MLLEKGKPWFGVSQEDSDSQSPKSMPCILPRSLLGGSGSHSRRHGEGSEESAVDTAGLPCMGRLQRRGRGWVHPESPGTSCTVTASVSIPPLLVSKLVFVAGEERHGRGSAVQHQEPQTRPRVRVQNVPRLQTTPLWLGEAPGAGWGTVTLHCLRVPCLATGLGFHCTQTMGCPQGPGLS